MGFADGLLTAEYAISLEGERVFAGFAVFADARTRAHEGFSAMATLTGDEIRATYREVSADVERRVMDVLAQGKPQSTLDLVNRVTTARGSQRDLIEALARLVDEGRVVATLKPDAPREWLSCVTWRLA